MDDSRLPKVCYERLKELSLLNPLESTHNWVTQLRDILIQLESHHLFDSSNKQEIKQEMEKILESYKSRNRQEDSRRIREAHFNTFYKEIRSADSQEEYLKYDTPLYKVRTISQLRVASDKLVRITLYQGVHTLETENICTICNQKKPETLEHFILECPVYTYYRVYLTNHFEQESTQKDKLKTILKIKSLEQLNDLFRYIELALNYRANILNEFS
ncbi:hypothetical protein M8J77_005730 [Diaphorina citri]|nr:hypothetical protein M8J77_005730 [Diaphorina citri]